MLSVAWITNKVNFHSVPESSALLLTVIGGLAVFYSRKFQLKGVWHEVTIIISYRSFCCWL